MFCPRAVLRTRRHAQHKRRFAALTNIALVNVASLAVDFAAGGSLDLTPLCGDN